MPNKLIDKVIETCNIPREKAEELWSQAEEIAKKQYHLGSKLSGKEYALVTGIFKKSLGKSCCQNLGWINEDNNILNSIHNLIQEGSLQRQMGIRFKTIRNPINGKTTQFRVIRNVV